VLPRATARSAASFLADSYGEYRTRFREITRRAAERFRAADWAARQRDAVERLELHERVLAPAVEGIATILGGELHERSAWGLVKDELGKRVTGLHDALLAETFFNSVSRRVLGTRGVDPLVEVRRQGPHLAPPPSRRDLAVYNGGSGLESVLALALRERSELSWPDAEGEAARAAAPIADALIDAFGAPLFDTLELVKAPFFRGKGAYLVGRLVRGGRAIPLVLALLNEGDGTVVDAVLTDENEVSIVFSFTRSYFHVDVEDPVALVAFLRTIMPKKPLAELYIAIGLDKHGKSELWRDLALHLAASDDLFVEAPGETGMVMTVFTLPSYDVVFKVIRDVFGAPKTSSREEVMAKYRLVFRLGRAGRLVDTQEFRWFELPVERFQEGTLGRLLRLAPASIELDGDRVLIRHLYTERRLLPLNLYLARADEASARAAVLDYGRALKELASTNVFPGDLLLKNFGVTRHGRVVFYDYDELALLLDCNFRELPAARTADEETSGEPWFYVGPNDVFPEELLPFLGLSGALKEAFLEEHGELLTVPYWTSMQERLRAGGILDVYPYPPARRLPRD
jgi:isocitrate dehydrogenase kinase/phosphatase